MLDKKSSPPRFCDPRASIGAGDLARPDASIDPSVAFGKIVDPILLRVLAAEREVGERYQSAFQEGPKE